MKIIIAVIKPDRLEAVKQELYKAEVNLITVTEVRDTDGRWASPRFIVESKRWATCSARSRFLIAVNDEFVEPTIKAIVKGGQTGEIGDGKIFVLPLEECVRIRTEERGGKAIG